MPRKKIQQFLDDKGVEYMVVEHSPAYAALDVAGSAHYADFERLVAPKVVEFRAAAAVA
jgi:hypothetical protein